MVKKKESRMHICSNCLSELDPKDTFVGKFPGKEYTTDYCEKCIKELGIEEVVPYLKPRVRKEKTTTKKPAALKTKKNTTTKKSTSKKTKK